MTADLPPRPDPETGEPRPPMAMSMGERIKGDPEGDERHKPPPPPGCGPVLEWYKESRGGLKHWVLAAFALLAVAATVQFEGFGWITHWGAWLITAIGVSLAVWIAMTRELAAGSDWFSRGKFWVNTYDLVKVRIVAANPTYILELEDSSGRRVREQIQELQLNPRLWDLVYNGILHSAHSRQIDANQKAIDWLRLPPHPPPTLAERQARDPRRPLPRRRAFRRLHDDR